MQCLDQIAGEPGVQQPALAECSQALGRRQRADAVLQRQRSHAVHDGKGADLLQVERRLIGLCAVPSNALHQPGVSGN